MSKSNPPESNRLHSNIHTTLLTHAPPPTITGNPLPGPAPGAGAHPDGPDRHGPGNAQPVSSGGLSVVFVLLVGSTEIPAMCLT